MRLSRRSFSLAAAAPFIVPAIVHGQGTPSSSRDFEPANDRLAGIFEYVPQTAVLGDTFGITWLDVERHQASVRERVEASTEEFTEDEIAFSSLYAAGSPLVQNAMALEDTTGFSFARIRQTVEFGEPPVVGTLVRLDQPAESLIPFWEAHDYELIEGEFGSFWSLDEEPAVNFDNPIQRAMMARLNNVAILEDDLIVYSASSEFIGEIMSMVAGETFTVNRKLGKIVAGVPEDATSAWFVDGGIMEYESTVIPLLVQGEGAFEEIEAMMAESDAAVGAMPIVISLGVGAGEGGFRHDEVHNPDSREFMVLQTSSFNMAEQAARVIDWRIQNFHNPETAEPYIDLLPDLEIDVIDGETLRISRPMPEPRTILPRMISNRDVLPFAFRWGQ